MDLSGCDAAVLRVRGDGRRYKLNLRTSSHFDGVVYQAAFATRNGAWLTVELPLADFAPRFRAVGFPDEDTVTGAQADIFRHYGISMEGLTETAVKLLK